VKTITAYFRSYFSNVPLDKVMWFTPPEEDDDEETEIDEGYNTPLPMATVATTATRDVPDKEEGEGAGGNDSADRKPPALISDSAEEDSKPAAAVETSPKEPPIQSK
jgi:hypothetical protein